MINIGFATVATLISSFIILVVKPASDKIEWGHGCCIDFMEDLFEDILQMIIRGLQVVCMVLWYNAAYNFTHQGSLDADFQKNMDLFWAATMTFLGASPPSPLIVTDRRRSPSIGND